MSTPTSVNPLTLTVALGDRSYPIHIGPGLVDDGERLASYLSGRQVMVVTNDTVAAHYLERLTSALAAADDRLRIETLVLPDGEAHKNVEGVSRIWDALLEAGFNRKATLVALGGGVIGDMVGFAAASYQRGISFIQVPTTLLSQVDSSVGGKTGVNHPLGKNMIGAFWQPRAVLIDTATLSTLPERELSAGLAEVIKYGLIHDSDFLGWLEDEMAALRDLDDVVLAKAIERSCAIKAEIVALDETEQDVRALLNLGHTFGHAIEAYMGYGTWLHGEAVGVGMLMAADLSMRQGFIEQADVTRTRRVIERAGLPVAAPREMTVEDFVSRMKLDKKNTDDRMRLVLMRALGEACVYDQTPPALLGECIETYPRA
ncbi:3-dehydroquinate synthase [Halomonas sp. DP5N14-9]|uniref:3-dehydroquinate synthase n=1 Tax=Halomonas sp. DP5N14-9 TaxID=2859075 RepID=UPI001C998D29|nr:3-dehydroquinate synthase [Halomonas sp. DP5N14-9]MBY5943280.1 3-dehydroquinate synthase [Halomonas sp. DP5N14-9]